MVNKASEGESEVSAATAVLLGALAPGVNGQTWNTLKVAFLMLGLCLSAMLALAFSASDFSLIIHVTFLVLITGALFFLLTRILRTFQWFQIYSFGVYATYTIDFVALIPQDAKLSCSNGPSYNRKSNEGDGLSS